MDRNTSHLSLFVPTQLREALEREAEANDRSLSAEVRIRLRASTSRLSGDQSSSSGDLHAPERQEASP